MKAHISSAALAIGFISGGASAGPIADLLNGVTGQLGAGSGLTGGVASTLNTITGGFNDSPLNALTTLPTVNENGGSLVGLGAFESDATGNGQLVGVGAGNDNQDQASGSGDLVGLGALQSGSSGNSDLIGVGALTGDNSGNGGLVGLSALSSGGGQSGQGGLIGAEVLNGDAVLGLNSGAAGQGMDIIPNPAGVSGDQLNGVVGGPLRDGLQSALQQGGDISGPLEGLVTTLDDNLVAPLGDGLSPVTGALGDVAGVGIDSTGNSIGGPASIANAVVTGDSTGGAGSDINAGVIGGDNQGNGEVVGAGAFSGENAGGDSGIVSLGAISGGNNGQGGDANVGVANDGAGANNNRGGLLNAGVANSGGQTTGGPTPPTPPTPVNLTTNTQAGESCTAGGQQNQTGLRGAAQQTQFNTRAARENGCTDPDLQQVSRAK